MTVLVRRSALKMWALAMGSIPLLIISIDVLTNRRITNWLREMLFRPEDTQIYEPRDVIYAWAIMLFALFLVLWGLKELFVPTKVIFTTDEGLAIRLRGPLRPPNVIPWPNLLDVAPGEIIDEGDRLALLRVQVADRDDLPDHPWGARWVEPRVLGILSQDWAEEPAAVAERIVDCAVEIAKKEAQAHEARIRQEPV